MLLFKESRISQFWLNWKSLGPISFDELHNSAVWHSFCTDRAVLHQVSTKRYVFLTFLSLKYDQYFKSFSYFGAPRIILLYICCFGLLCLQDLKIKKIMKMAKNMHVEKKWYPFSNFSDDALFYKSWFTLIFKRSWSDSGSSCFTSFTPLLLLILVWMNSGYEKEVLLILNWKVTQHWFMKNKNSLFCSSTLYLS